MDKQRRHRIHDRLMLAVYCGLAGAVLSVVIAWGSVCWSPAIEVVDGQERRAASLERIYATLVTEYCGFGITETWRERTGGLKDITWRLAAGWPLRCLFIERRRQEGNTDYYIPLKFTGPTSGSEGIVIPRWIPWCDYENTSFWPNGGVVTRYLPTRPIWTQCMGNTLFWSVLTLVLFHASRVVHRTWRAVHNRCVVCGYPRGASNICSECGTPCGPA